MPRGVYDRSKAKPKTTTEKVKKVYRTKTSAPRLTQASTTETVVQPHSMNGFQNLIAYYHALVVSKTQGVQSKVLETEINDTVIQLRSIREELYGMVGTKTAVAASVTPTAVAASAVIQEASPEVPKQAVFTPPA